MAQNKSNSNKNEQKIDLTKFGSISPREVDLYEKRDGGNRQPSHTVSIKGLPLKK